MNERRQDTEDQPTPPLAAQSPARSVGDYRLLQKIGEGGMVSAGYSGNAIFTDPDLDSLRGDAAFELLAERVRNRLADAAR